VELRAYTAGDAQATSVIFLRAVRETARAHYSPEQIEAWAASYGDLDSWAAARAAAHTQLAIIDGHVAGFTDLDDHGYIDMLSVDPDFGRHGVASALLASVVALARQRGLPALTGVSLRTAESSASDDRAGPSAGRGFLPASGSASGLIFHAVCT
jgi:putative acetyltransferase